MIKGEISLGKKMLFNYRSEREEKGNQVRMEGFRIGESPRRWEHVKEGPAADG